MVREHFASNLKCAQKLIRYILVYWCGPQTAKVDGYISEDTLYPLSQCAPQQELFFLNDCINNRALERVLHGLYVALCICKKYHF